MRYTSLTFQMLPLDVQAELLTERVKRMRREGIKPIRTSQRLLDVQRKQARELKARNR